MWLVKRLAFGVFAFFPAIAISVGLAGTKPGSRSVSAAHPAEIAQATAEAPADAGAANDSAATEEAGEEGTEEEPVIFTEDFLADAAHIEGGKEVWEGTCRGCHGAQAYPGKAPKLRPKRYTPEFVFDRVTNGYKQMPAWKDVFTKEERMDVVAWILSDDFAP
ncbi:MAG TPA: cytochrome c [Propylenella sp.]